MASKVVAPVASASAGVAPISETPRGRTCARCRGVGDPGAEFCKFCGARYDDAVHDAGANGSMGSPPPAFQARSPHDFAQSVGAVQPSAPGTPLDASAVRARLISIRKDGSDGQAYALRSETTDLGRGEGHIVLEDDPYLSLRHARVRRRGEDYFLRDLDSVNGVYVRIREPVELSNGDMILIGQQVLRYETLVDAELPLGPAALHGTMLFGTPEVSRYARLVQYTTEGVGRDVYCLYRDETVLGRENGDIVFTDDPFLSRRHASISVDRASRSAVLKDMGSSNGTSVRAAGEYKLRHGDNFRLGRHLFRFEHPSGEGGSA